MGCAVRDVVENPTLATRVLAGRRGLEQSLTWAHSVELARPWEWLGSGELLMITGQNFPSDPERQMDFVRNLHGNGIAGLALAERMTADLTLEAAALADELGFPVLETAYEIPFVLIARAVAVTNGRDAQVAAIQRLYELYRQSTLEGVSGEEAIARLGRELGTRLRVLAVEGWGPVLAGDAEFMGYGAELVERFPAGRPLPAVTRISGDAGMRILLLPIGEAPRFALAAEVGDQPVDLVLLQHVAAICGVHAEMRATEIATRSHVSTRLLTQILSGGYDAGSAYAELEDLGVGSGPWTVAAVAGEPDLLDLYWRMHRAGVPTLVCRLQQYAVVLFAEEQRAAACTVLDSEGAGIERVGISNPIQRIAAVADGVREAAWASQAVAAAGSRVAEYGSDRPLFMPATVTEARDAVERVLGLIDAYDRDHGTELLRSLEVYFDENRSGQAASKRLEIHRQTLIYRLKRIEQLTDRRFDNLDDLTELHLAMRIRRQLVAEVA